MPDTTETESTVSLIFELYFHFTNSDEMVDVSRNSEVIGDVIVALKSEYCSHTYNWNNEHCDEVTTWYDYVDISSINIHTHYEPLLVTEEILNNIEVVIFSDDHTQKRDTTSPLNKLADLHQYWMYDLPWAQMDRGATFTVTNNLHLLIISSFGFMMIPLLILVIKALFVLSSLFAVSVVRWRKSVCIKSWGVLLGWCDVAYK